MDELTAEEIEFLIESLGYTKRNFESTTYPTKTFREEQLKSVDGLIEKLRRIKKVMG